MGSPIKIRTEMLAALARYAHTDEARPTVCCVMFRNDEAIATNGHILVRAKHPTHGHHFAVSRKACFAAVAAQDALERHFSDRAMRLGADIEAGYEGDTILIDAPHGDREIHIEHADGHVRFALGQGVAIGAPAVDFSEKPYPDVNGVTLTPSTGPVPRMGFQTGYIDALDVLARAAGYYARGARVEAWDTKLGSMQWVIPPDPDAEDDPVRVVICRLLDRDEHERNARPIMPRRSYL